MSDPILKTKGPCIILAGAGTGKTYTIVEKLKHILQNNIYPTEKIVCLTFSNEAANSLRERILPTITNDREPIIKTFHAFCADILQSHGEKIQIPEDFTILIPDDAKIMLHKNLKIQPHLCHKYISAISTAKDLGITIEQYQSYLNRKIPEEHKENLKKHVEELQFKLQTFYLKPNDKKKKSELKNKTHKLQKLLNIQKFVKTWIAYEKLKKLKNLQDYSDLNQKALELLEKHPEITEEYKYIIVDEFQDTNKLQCDFLTKIAPHKNITVVGDLNQSIYRFRGAYKENLSLFKKSFNTTEKDIFTLNKSYRSTNKILKIAHKLIKNNYKNHKDCFEVTNALNKSGSNIQIYELENNKEEVRKIIELIKKEVNLGTPHEEICIMFRTHQQTRLLKNSLKYEKIPYVSITKESLLKTTPIKITIDYLTILEKLKNKSQGGEQAWWDLIHNSNFNKEDLIRISKFIKDNKKSPCLSLKILNSKQLLQLTEKGNIQFQILIKKIKKAIPYINKPIPELILKIYEITGLNNSENIPKENILILQKFHEISLEYSKIDSPYLANFIHHLEIIKSLGIEIDSPSLEKKGVRIMTHHSTKGLEYNTIIISNLAQKKFPIEHITSNQLIPPELSPELQRLTENATDSEIESLTKSYEQKNQILEERRLCYVAFTRAKEKLICTYAKKYNGKKHLPSQFLNEINYKQNPIIDVIKDNNEKYQEPQIEIVVADKLYSVENHAESIKINSNQEITSSDNLIFSPSSLQIFDQCQKKYEYKYLYNMPEPLPISWEAIKLGSFVHLVFERGVTFNFKTEKEFIDLAKTLKGQEQWSFIEIQDAIQLIKIFFKRNKHKYNKKSLTEKKLSTKINNLKFQGIADRIDINNNNELEIIDYKTGSTNIKPKYRNWQLGFYALASQSLGTPRKLTLDLLKKEKPLEFELDKKGNATEINSGRMSFNLDEIKEELLETANNILKAYNNGFKPCSKEKNCEFCSEYVWEN